MAVVTGNPTAATPAAADAIAHVAAAVVELMRFYVDIMLHPHPDVILQASSSQTDIHSFWIVSASMDLF